MAAKNEPLSHLRRCEISSGSWKEGQVDKPFQDRSTRTRSGVPATAYADLTKWRTHDPPRFDTSSQHRIYEGVAWETKVHITFTLHFPRTQSSARYMFAARMSAPAPCYRRLARLHRRRDGRRAGTEHGTDVEEDANVWYKNGTKCVEEPVVRIDLLLVFLL